MKLVVAMLSGALVTALVLALTVAARCQPAPPHRVVLSIVAHADDDLLFMNPDIAADIRARHAVWTLVLTDGRRSGNALQHEVGYVQTRMDGLKDAYATMARLPDVWTPEAVTLNGHEVEVNHLLGADVHLVFLSLRGAANSHRAADPFGDLFRLLHDPTFEARPTDGRAAYTFESLVKTLRALITSVNPDHIRSPYSLGHRDAGLARDHCDHTSAGILAGYGDSDSRGLTLRTRSEYLHYGVRVRPDNDPLGSQGAKYRAWQAYVRHVRDFPGPHAWSHGLTGRRYAPAERSFPAGAPWTPPTDFVACVDDRQRLVTWEST